MSSNDSTSKTGLPSETDIDPKSSNPVLRSIETMYGSLPLQNEWEIAMADSSVLVSIETPQAHFSPASAIEDSVAAEANHQLGIGESSSESTNSITSRSSAIPHGSATESEHQTNDATELQDQDLQPTVDSNPRQQDKESSDSESASVEMNEDVDDLQLLAPPSSKVKATPSKKTKTLAQLIDSASGEDEEAEKCEESTETDPLESIGDSNSGPKRRRRRSAAEMLAAATQNLMKTPAYTNFSIDLTAHNDKSTSSKRKADDSPLVETPQKKRSQRIREQEHELVASGSQQDLAVQPPKKRGRPPKVRKASTPKPSPINAITDPPKRRGRPRKVKMNVIDVESLPEVASATAAAVQSGGAYEVPVTPKKRGRPKKVTPAADMTALQAGPAPEASPVTPKRRGRPPKIKQ